MHPDPDVRPMEDQMAHLEQALIEDFIRQRGHNPERINELPSDERDALLRQATIYAAAKLAEVEARAHYVHEIHGNR
ncbi:MAG TPA: hypothetical protein VKD69_03260, partial [Vicinamibacterales bacterium]|nr:hypothetical protein [Vicinamibacterales bacterium]